jgi:hypothetical protein
VKDLRIVADKQEDLIQMVQDAEPIFLQNLQVLAHPFTPPLAWIILSEIQRFHRTLPSGQNG